MMDTVHHETHPWTAERLSCCWVRGTLCLLKQFLKPHQAWLLLDSSLRRKYWTSLYLKGPLKLWSEVYSFCPSLLSRRSEPLSLWTSNFMPAKKVSNFCCVLAFNSFKAYLHIPLCMSLSLASHLLAMLTLKWLHCRAKRLVILVYCCCALCSTLPPCCLLFVWCWSMCGHASVWCYWLDWLILQQFSLLVAGAFVLLVFYSWL